MNPNPPSLPSQVTSSKIAIWIIAGLALAVAILWAVDTYVGRDKAIIILTVLLVFLAVVLVLWFLYWLIRKIIRALSASRARRDEALAAAPRQGATPQEQAELDVLQEKLNTAVRVIRESKLARGRKPEEAIYTLPWVLLLGPRESGKTTALRESGIDFPYTTAEDRKSTRSKQVSACEYWFSRGGIVLDLAGRVGAEDDSFDIFKGFVDQLKRARRLRPLDGVVVSVSLPEIIGSSPEQMERMANRLRARFDEMIRRMGIRFPIYILFTKCDQMPGFRDFFGNLRSKDRGQVWGATISRSQRKRAPADQIFQQEFDRLVESLAGYRLQLLAGEKDNQKLPRIYSFPTGLATLRDRLASFVGLLLQPTPYSERPMFRGFYLTSAAAVAPAEAQPAVLESAQKWEPGRRFVAAQEPPKETKNYFLESLFPKIVFADRPMAMANVDTRLRRRLWLDVVFVSTLLICTVLLVGMLFSFFENRSLIATTKQRALRVGNAVWNGKQISDLTALEELRQKVEELDQYETSGPRWILRWGLYSGKQMNKQARHVYFQRLMETFVRPSATALLQRLLALSSQSDRSATFSDFHSTLKAYMMMTDPDRSEASFLSNAVAPIWKKIGPPEAENLALKQARFYAEQLPKKDQELLLTMDNPVVMRAQNSLCAYPAVNRVYNNLKEEGNSKFPPYTLTMATGGKSLEFLYSSYEVPGVFSEAGWTNFFKSAVEKASGEVAKDDWVLSGRCAALGAAQVTDADYRKRILDLYFAEYADHWTKFLAGISVRSLADLNEARAALESFSQTDSAVSRLLLSVAANTMLKREPEKGGSISGMVATALATVGLSTKPNRTELIDAVEEQFRPLHEAVTSPDGKEPALSAKYVLALAKVHAKLDSLFGGGGGWEQVKAYVASIATNISGDEFHEGYAQVNRVKQACKTRSTAPIGPMLEQPLRQAWAAILRDVGLRLDGLWKSQVAEGFKSNVETKFPFNPQGQDLPLVMLSQYLKPKEGAVWAFYDKELSMFLTLAESRYAPKELFSSQVEFSQAFLEFMSRASAISRAFYGAGSQDPTVTFDITPDGTHAVTDSLLVIDGVRLLYRNELPLPQSFSWPAKVGTPSHAEFSISVGGTGERPGLPKFDGEWAFFRLLNLAQVGPQSPTLYGVTWSIRSSDGRRFDIKYKLQARSVQNPFIPNFLNNVSCPERLSKAPIGGAQ